MATRKQIFQLLLLLPIALALACGPHEVYSSEDAGWNVRFPAEYKRMTPQEIAAIETKGKSAIQGELEPVPYTRLLFVKKGDTSGLTSTLTPYSDNEQSVAENQLQMAQMLKETYGRYGIPAQIERESMLLDGLAFDVLHVTLLSKDSKSVVSRQMILERLIEKSNILTIALYFRSDQAKQELLSIANSSKFSKRN